MTTCALTIAWSDPSSGAWVQADLCTFASLGVAGLSAAAPPVEVERIAEIRVAFPEHPIVAIGGLAEQSIAAVAQAWGPARRSRLHDVCAPEMQRAMGNPGRQFRQGGAATS